MLALRQVSAHYDGAIVALDHVDASVGAGQIVALLGANGAGKTTLLKAIAGMLPFDRGDIVGGDILFEDASLLGRHPAEISRRGIALVQDGRQCFRQLTVAENLQAASFAHPKGAAERLELVQGYFPFLCEMMDRKAGLLSGGQLQMLVIGMAIMCNPRLLMLDEPSLGLSPVMVQSVFDAIERMHRELKMTIVVAEQTVPRLLKIASDAYVLSRGRIVMHAPPSAMTEEELQKVYLN
ncbi:ABC transporter ATP-binding protein [Bradyrhizobium sp. STM 3809]|uniref:ABC transporter ATP-binding protein n=1 Tax=Bradyrhizobium sp. STM 3809 TaxID=551936 RepID=UPI0002407088|nr:ABC transporter ATP-binding protein [Bradyrhizobium sp. STM 3809]CCD98259.1 putative branched-chain amino acid ABC transporter, ATP binding protein [Bradyrhizobium sp. STM 3809]